MATFVIAPTYAGIYAPGGIVDVREGDDDYIITEETPGVTAPAVDSVVQYAPLVKDGGGNAIINASLTMSAALYVREGKLTVSGSDTILAVEPEKGGIQSGNAPTIFNVAGKNAMMVVDGATIQTSKGAALNVGGPDGNGELIIKNQGKVYNKPQGSSLFIGYPVGNYTYNNVHGTTVSGTDSTPYQGISTTGADGVTEFGRGVVTVEGESELWTGYSGVFVGEGELNVKDKSSVYVGYDMGLLKFPNSLSAQFGRNNSTSVINITGGSLLSMGSYLGIGYDVSNQNNIDVTVKIDGEGSQLKIDSKYGAFIGYKDAVTSKISISLTDGGNMTLPQLCMGASSDTNNVQFSVDEKSSLNVTSLLQLGSIVDLDSAGTIQAGSIVMQKGSTLKNSGKLSAATIEIGDGGVLENDGTVTGSLSALSGSTIKQVYTGTAQTGAAPITLGTTDSWSMLSGSVFVLIPTIDVIDNLNASNEVAVLVADAMPVTNDSALKIEGLGEQWDVALEWSEIEGAAWITGTIDAVENVVVDAETELSEDISDVDDTTSRTLTVTADTTISGDNTHSGGTTISDADVTLGSATALGNGVVTTSGTSSITTEDGVAAVLKQSISNTEGTLTLNGSYDVTALETQDVDPTWLNSDLEPGENGFYQDKGSSVQVVENGEDGVLSPDSDATIKHGNREYILNTDTGMAIAPGEIDWSVYHMNTSNHEAKVSEIIEASKDAQGDALLQQIQMSAGTLGVNQSVYLMAAPATNENGEIVARPVINVSGDDTELSGMIDCATMHASGGKISATLHGDTSLTVTGDVEISGDSSQTGDTIITGPDAKLTISTTDTALGASTVKLQNQATLDLNHMAANNMIEVTGCTVANAENYVGRMEVASHMTFVGPASAGCISLRDKGAITAESLRTTTLEALSDKGADRYNEHTIIGDVTINDSGAIILYSGKQITLTRGSLTLGNGVAMVLLDAGGEFAVGDILVTCISGTITGDFSELDFLINNEQQEGYRVEISEDRKSVVLAEEDKPIVDPDEEEEDKPIVDPGEDEEDKPIVGPEEDEEDKPIVGPDVPVQPEPAPVFEQTTADVLAQGNWGVVSASRAFVGAVQGQRNNMGCIANGRGTAWASLLGGMTDISGSGAAAGSDITLFGAAVGVDMKVGKRSSLGVAFGYTDGEVSADGLGDIDQEGGHIALYGEHGLKKFANNSCLSLDWVAATGTTESKYMGAKWEQDSVQLNTRLTWNKQVTDRFSYNVFGGLEYFASESDRTMNCKSGSIQNLRGELGVGVRYVAGKGAQPITDGKCAPAPACERVVLYGEVSYINDMVRNNPSIEVNGLRGSGANPGRQGVGVEAGATIRLGEKWSASANYSFNAMDDANEHVLNIGASRTF